MRQRIRLTESKLRNIINECIKQYLTELDWKTYANASRERAKRDGRDSEHTFNYDRAASRALNDKYPSKNRGFEDAEISTNYDDYNGHRQVGRFPSLGQRGDFADTFCADIDNPDDNWEMTNSGANNDRTKEMSDYFKGNYDYEPNGRGWHLKK